MAKFIVYKDRAGEYRWFFRADNGEVIADSSEGYVEKSDCLHNIGLVKTQAPGAEIEDLTQHAATYSTAPSSSSSRR